MEGESRTAAPSLEDVWVSSQGHRDVTSGTVFSPPATEGNPGHLPGEDPPLTAERCDNIRAFDQGTEDWLAARIYRMTTSIIYFFCGFGGAGRQTECFQNLILQMFEGNFATRHGNKCEPYAERDYVQFLYELWGPLLESVEIRHEGLHCTPEYPHCGASADGIVILTFTNGDFSVYLVEYKCPIGPIYPTVPPYYSAQMTFCQGLYAARLRQLVDELERSRSGHHRPHASHFVVWKAGEPLSVRSHAYDEAAFHGIMRVATQVYMDRFLPALRTQRELVCYVEEEGAGVASP